ncbi:hypothetical protein CgunFtcFv8_017660 [Champsocephalus gunnari]|uniref:Uncharacterized protein n=1 Tax=Champsocephalus gunnari TaxID=52237 RepID=A0AAN8DMP7_CHAGU|nr:hypothetical protein CgunFtcFv8_017660 [Champsocephalus gunnari]
MVMELPTPAQPHSVPWRHGDKTKEEERRRGGEDGWLQKVGQRSSQRGRSRLMQPGIQAFLMCEFCPLCFSSSRLTSEQQLPSHVG